MRTTGRLLRVYLRRWTACSCRLGKQQGEQKEPVPEPLADPNAKPERCKLCATERIPGWKEAPKLIGRENLTPKHPIDIGRPVRVKVNSNGQVELYDAEIIGCDAAADNYTVRWTDRRASITLPTRSTDIGLSLIQLMPMRFPPLP